MGTNTTTIQLNDPSLFLDFYRLSRKVAKRPLVLFFGRETFSDNSKYLFLSCLKEKQNYEVLWCTFNKALHETLLSHKLPSVLITKDLKQTVDLMLTAAVAVFCENPHNSFSALPILGGCLGGARKIQLWHGISVKQLDLMLIPHVNLLIDETFRRSCVYSTDFDYFVSSSSHLDSFWVKAHGARSILRAGQARNEVIIRDAYGPEFIESVFSEQADEKFNNETVKILITPTWQRKGKVWISSEAFYEKIESIAIHNNLTFCIKLHPFLLDDLGISVRSKKYNRVVFLNSGFDLYPWLKYFSLMITDYSSIMFDFILTERPIMTYKIQPAKKLDFEPDYSLVPDLDFSYDFDESDFEKVLFKSLNEHPILESQKKMCEALYETAPLNACDKLKSIMSTIVNKVVNPQVSIDTI